MNDKENIKIPRIISYKKNKTNVDIKIHGDYFHLQLSFFFMISTSQQSAEKYFQITRQFYSLSIYL